MDLGAIVSAGFRDPAAWPKFLLGSGAALLSVVPIIGTLPLWGYQAGTLRAALRGARHPFADWYDFGDILYDGLRVLAVKLLWGIAAVGLGLVLASGVRVWLEALGRMEPPVPHELFFAGGIIAAGITVAWFAVFHVLQAIALIRMVATDRFGEAFRVSAIFKTLIRNPGTGLLLLLTILIVRILGSFGLLACVVGVLPGMFWASASEGIAMAHAGRIMEIHEHRDD